MSDSRLIALEAEKSVLGALLSSPDFIKTVGEMALDSQHFYNPSHQKLYKAILNCFEKQNSCSIPTVESYLTDTNQLAALGGKAYLFQLFTEAATETTIRSYIKLVMDKYQLRQLVSVANEIRELSSSGEGLNEIFDLSEEKILSITRNRRTSDFQKAGNVATMVENQIVKLSKENRTQTGLVSGFIRLDNMTHGFQNGDLILLAARPSVGKTAFALNLALEVARRNKTGVAIFSLEMAAHQLITRMLASLSHISSSKLQTGYGFTNQDWSNLSEQVNVLRHTDIFIDDSSMTKMSDIFSKCRKLKNDGELGMIVIDYIQLINSSGIFESRQQEVSYISRQLKMLARELNVPVIALSQLTRGVESRSDKRPMLSDLRESGSLEQDADIVMFLYREEYHKEDRANRPEEERIEVILAKHRNGEVGVVPLSFEGKINRYTSIVDTPESGN